MLALPIVPPVTMKSYVARRKLSVAGSGAVATSLLSDVKVACVVLQTSGSTIIRTGRFMPGARTTSGGSKRTACGSDTHACSPGLSGGSPGGGIPVGVELQLAATARAQRRKARDFTHETYQRVFRYSMVAARSASGRSARKECPPTSNP